MGRSVLRKSTVVPPGMLPLVSSVNDACRLWAILDATPMVGLFSPRSTLESMARLTPECRDSCSNVMPAVSRNLRIRAPNARESSSLSSDALFFLTCFCILPSVEGFGVGGECPKPQERDRAMRCCQQYSLGSLPDQRMPHAAQRVGGVKSELLVCAMHLYPGLMPSLWACHQSACTLGNQSVCRKAGFCTHFACHLTAKYVRCLMKQRLTWRLRPPKLIL